MKMILSSIASLLTICAVASAAEKLYDEQYRPQFHFSPAKNWTNDPNGMVYYKGEYHLFFQHNPEGIEWGNMTWGHAVSSDMLQWSQLDHAILPDKLGTIFSGSAVVDWDNTAGFQTDDEKTIVCVYTSAGGTSTESQGQPFTQSIAYSNDRGRTFTKYEHNPVLQHLAGANRDPKIVWHVSTKKWIMILYLDDDKAKNDYILLSSPNLKQWTKLCVVSLPGATECPDFFELPVDGDATKTKWVFWCANNSYCLGQFDGTTFTAETDMLQTHWGTNRYAAQTFSDIPASEGRRIQIAWMNGGKYPDMPFNQQMSFPATLTLRSFPDGVRLCSRPVKEIDNLHGKQCTWSNLTLKPGDNPLAAMTGELFDIRLDVAPGTASEVGLNVRGTPIRYDVKEGKLSCLGTSAPVELCDGRLQLHILIDRSSIEIFTADGRANMAYCFLPPSNNKTLTLTAQGGEAVIRSLNVWELNSSWPK